VIAAKEVASRLALRAEGVCQLLLPDGKAKSGEWRVGSVNGEAGESLRIKLTGDRAGLWLDFADRERSGDLLDLWAEVRGLSIREAWVQATEWLGLETPQFAASRSSRVQLAAPKPASPDDAAMNWLRETRKIPQATINAYRVTASQGAVVLTAYAPDGSAQYRKFRLAREKKFWSQEGGKPCLFGWQAIPNRSRSALICEGELDALAWHAYGFPALSPTNGAEVLDWIDREYDELARFDVLHLSWDMDAAGQQALPRIIERLGVNRCRVVQLPCKDANQCLMDGVAREKMEQAVREAKSMDPSELVSASGYAEDVIAEFYNPHKPTGVLFPWDKGSDQFAFRRGEVSLLAGVNGHGKSQIAGHLLLGALTQGERACVASLEFRPVRWLARLARQATGLASPSEDYLRTVHDWYQQKLWVYAATGSVDAARVLEVFRYAARRYGVRWFVIDNLAKCGFAEDDYNGQKAFVDRLTDFARDFDVHVMLVLHMRKGETEDKPAGKMDIKGTGAIVDMADSAILIWRNKPKEGKRREAVVKREEFDEGVEPDALFRVLKQRNGEDEPSIRLWFDRASCQYLDSPQRARPIVPYLKSVKEVTA
jgi:twinkle protein